ncbi:hypothetical protein [Brevibacterium litoralis]|uniref:hypothetical protein n=1 Tax=Brevibacterium litoralis TaxID=3138935 RepID=UPI0032EFA6B3
MPDRPGALYLPVALVALQGLALVALAVFYLVLGWTAGGTVRALIGLSVMFLLMGVVLGAIAAGLFRMVRWARPAVIAWQVLAAIGAFVFGSQVGIAVIVVGVLVVGGLVLPAVTRPYDVAVYVHQQEAALHRSEMEEKYGDRRF